jgi:hypothetical protein
MGHEGYLASAYRRYTKEQMAEYYAKSENMVTLQISPKDITRVETELKKEMQEQQAVITRLVRQNEEREAELKALKRIMVFAEERKT